MYVFGSLYCCCFCVCVCARATNIVAANRIYTVQKREREKKNERGEKRERVHASRECAVLMLVHIGGALSDKTKPAA